MCARRYRGISRRYRLIIGLSTTWGNVTSVWELKAGRVGVIRLAPWHETKGVWIRPSLHVLLDQKAP